MRLLNSFLFLILFFVSFGAWAQSQKAKVINDGALVYKDADFDAPVLTQLRAGQVYDISLKTKGPFYKIRLKAGLLGWIADTDVRTAKPAVAGKSAEPGKKGEKPAEKKKEESKDNFLEKKRTRSFYGSRYRGPVISYLTYNENTMGALHSENMPFYGFKVEGPNTMFTGDFRTDAEFLFHFSAPGYYEKATGYPASGWIFLTDFVFETAYPQSKWHMLTFGFGPMFKYSHYQVSLLQNSKQISYSLDDMNLGAVFDGGLAFRIAETYALRFNIKYYWEKTKYWGGSITFGFPF
jgi:hypothetical protein